MGKSLVIKGANFATVAVKKVILYPIIDSVETDISNSFSWTDGKCIIEDGSVINSLYYEVSNAVDVSEFDKIRIAQPMYRVGPIQNGWPTICFLGETNNLISAEYYRMTDIDGQPSTEMYEYTLPEGTKYIRTNYFTDSYQAQWPQGHFIEFKCFGIKYQA